MLLILFSSRRINNPPYGLAALDFNNFSHDGKSNLFRGTGVDVEADGAVNAVDDFFAEPHLLEPFAPFGLGFAASQCANVEGGAVKYNFEGRIVNFGVVGEHGNGRFWGSLLFFTYKTYRLFFLAVP